MNNIICIFFGHKDDEITFTGSFHLTLSYTMDDGKNFPLANFKKCERCGGIYLNSLPDKNEEWQSKYKSG